MLGAAFTEPLKSALFSDTAHVPLFCDGLLHPGAFKWTILCAENQPAERIFPSVCCLTAFVNTAVTLRQMTRGRVVKSGKMI
jgi:hypothetical protein